MLKFLVAIIISVFFMTSNSYAYDLQNTIYLQLKNGRVVIELNPDVAPKHVERIKELVRAKFYDNVPFHRVIENFMAQTGDPTGTGTGGSDKPDLKAEFNTTPHFRGVVSMARAADPNSANSQFFIVYKDAPHLDGKYTAFGKVVEGMEFVDQIKKGDLNNRGMVTDPDYILSMRVAADVYPEKTSDKNAGKNVDQEKESGKTGSQGESSDNKDKIQESPSDKVNDSESNKNAKSEKPKDLGGNGADSNNGSKSGSGVKDAGDNKSSVPSSSVGNKKEEPKD